MNQHLAKLWTTVDVFDSWRQHCFLPTLTSLFAATAAAAAGIMQCWTSVCLSVCLCTGWLKNCGRILVIFWGI